MAGEIEVAVAEDLELPELEEEQEAKPLLIFKKNIGLNNFSYLHYIISY